MSEKINHQNMEISDQQLEDVAGGITLAFLHRKETCPHCGYRVEAGVIVCPKCQAVVSVARAKLAGDARAL